MTVIFNDMGETVWTGRRARDIERRADELRLQALTLEGHINILKLTLKAVGDTGIAATAEYLAAVIDDELEPHVRRLRDAAEEVERYGHEHS